YHQDIKFRSKPELFGDLDTGWVTTGLALNKQGGDNGALCVYPGSHRMGYLGLGEGATVMTGGSNEDELRAAGLDPDGMVQLELEPGDLVMWTLHTLHGSQPNTSDRDRLFVLNSYARATDSPTRGEWAFRDGQSIPLGETPEICKYEELLENPGPFYADDDWSEEAVAQA
ncbi:MAG: phytanoyl-CoA dioxygenase family protein, partial [Alphaproteobacteria bacterium]